MAGGAAQIVVLAGDETGQELLEQSLRVLDPGLLGVELELLHFDLSLERRRATQNAVVDEAARAMRDAGLGLKAATITPEGADDVGSLPRRWAPAYTAARSGRSRRSTRACSRKNWTLRRRGTPRSSTGRS